MSHRTPSGEDSSDRHIEEIDLALRARMQVAPEDDLALGLRCQSNHSGLAGVEMHPFDAFAFNANGQRGNRGRDKTIPKRVLVADDQ